jgi:hypothetical protein
VLDRGEHRVDVLHEIPRLGVEQHVLLLDAERVRIARAERMVEHAAATAPGPSAPLPVIDGGKICCISAAIIDRLGFDLDEPARVEQGGDDPGGRRARVRERLPVRAADLVDVRGVGDVDAGAHDIVERRAGLVQRRSMISRQTCACSYGVVGGSASPGMIGAVPETHTWLPTLTARE